MSFDDKVVRAGAAAPRTRVVGAMFLRRDPILITSAAEPRQDEIRRREQRYVLTMMVRVVCFVLAVVAFTGWLRIVAVALAVILPWIAVVVANGGPPKSNRRQAGFVEKAPTEAQPLVLEAGTHVIVDAEPVGEPGSHPAAAPGAERAMPDERSVPDERSMPGGWAMPDGGAMPGGWDVPGGRGPGPRAGATGGPAGRKHLIVDGVVEAQAPAADAPNGRHGGSGPA